MTGPKDAAETRPSVYQHIGMATQFLAVNVIPRELAAALMSVAPANPFCTKSYAEAMHANGQQVWLLGTKRGGELVAGCYGLIASGHLNRCLQIPSLPHLPSGDVFWDGLMRFCSSHRIHCLELANSLSSGTHIPLLLGEVERRDTFEYVLDLGDPDWERKLARHHRRKIERALQAGVTVRRTAGVDACREHVRLVATSMERRRRRGESAAVPGGVKQQRSLSLALTEKGAGELFQAVECGEVLSSAIVLRAAEGARYYTAGTSPQGTKCGASHFLLYSIARVLRGESVRRFDLGTAADGPGLDLFKLRFGAAPVFLEHATFYLGSDLRRRLTTAAHYLRQSGSALLRRIGAAGRGLQLSASVLAPCSTADRVPALWPPCDSAQGLGLSAASRLGYDCFTV